MRIFMQPMALALPIRIIVVLCILLGIISSYKRHLRMPLPTRSKAARGPRDVVTPPRLSSTPYTPSSTTLPTSEPSTTSEDIIRPIGGYEKLMSRKIPNSSSVALSHGAVYLYEGTFDENILSRAIAFSIDKHPLLRSYIRANLDVPENPLTGPELVWIACDQDSDQLVKEVVSYTQVSSSTNVTFEKLWKKELELSLNEPSFPERGPLWRLKVLHTSQDEDQQMVAMVFTMNHGLDDQQSLNILMIDILTFYNELEQTDGTSISNYLKPYSFPKPMEEAICPQGPGLATLDWSIFQLGNSAAGALTLPERVIDETRNIPSDIKETREVLNTKYKLDNRKTKIELFQIEEAKLAKIRKLCKNNDITVTQFFSALMLYVTDAIILGEKAAETRSGNAVSRKLRFLLSVGLRPFGANDAGDDWTGGTVACAGGAIDFIVPIHGANFLINKKESLTEGKLPDSFVKTAKLCKDKAKNSFDRGFVQESVRLFGLGMKYADILQVVELAAANTNGLGREYSCGVSNCGVVTLPDLDSVEIDKNRGVSTSRESIRQLAPRGVYYGTSHARNGVVCQLSCQTTNGALYGCLQYPFPLLTKYEASLCRQRIIDFVDLVAI